MNLDRLCDRLRVFFMRFGGERRQPEDKQELTNEAASSPNFIRKFLNNRLDQFLRSSTIDLRSHKVTDELFTKIINEHTEKSKVTTIIVTNSKLTVIPPTIGKFKNLVTLRICNCHVTEIPWSVIYLHKLKEFDLAHNCITHVPNMIYCLKSLRELNLQGNNIQRLPTSLLRLEKLKKINVEGNVNLIAPPLSIAIKGKEEIFKCLEERQNRSNLWQGYAACYNACNTSGNRIRTLLDLCISCVFENNVDYLSTELPPMMKQSLYETAKITPTTFNLAKCSRCCKYFSSVEIFRNHDCGPHIPERKVQGTPAITQSSATSNHSGGGTNTSTNSSSAPERPTTRLRSEKNYEVDLHRCEQCQKYFSNEEFIKTHTCSED